MLSHLSAELSKNHLLVQDLICALGTGAVLLVVWGAYAFKLRSPDKKGLINTATAILIVLLCCAMLFAPFSVLQGDGQIHQAKIAYLANAMRHGRLPEWSFLWYGGSDVSECYGPLYYPSMAIVMLLTGMSTKWTFAVVTFACTITVLFVALPKLSRAYGQLAAVVATLCFLLSPARTGLYWWDGRPHAIVIDSICAIYVLFLAVSKGERGPLRTGCALGLSSTLCVMFHLQYGALATIILFAYTGMVSLFADDLTIQLGSIWESAKILAMGALVFLVFALPHYVYYYSITPDMVASASSSLNMFSSVADRWPALLAEVEWAGWYDHWDAHYVGLVPLALSVFAVVRLFRRDRFAVVGGLFVVGLFLSAIILRRNAAFAPVFYLPAVAGAVEAIRRDLAKRQIGAEAPARRRRAAFGFAVLLSVVLIDLAPSSFISPYRPGAGERPLVAELKSEPATLGRTLVIGPGGGYSLLMPDEKRGGAPLELPSFFGPTAQLSTRIFGLTTAAARLAWLEHVRSGAIDPQMQALLSVLDVSRLVFYGQQKDIQVVEIPTARPAWRIRSFVCDGRPAPLASISWDVGRSIGQGLTPAVGDVLGGMRIDTTSGVVDGVRIDCNAQGAPAAGSPVRTPGDAVSGVSYDRTFERAMFKLDAGSGGLFLTPFGYYRNLQALNGVVRAKLYRTDNWMSVLDVPMGENNISLSSRSDLNSAIRLMDVIFVLGLLYFVFGRMVLSGRRSRES